MRALNSLDVAITVFVPFVSGIWASLIWPWWFGFRLKLISANDQLALKDIACFTSGQKWPKKFNFASFAKVKPKSMIHKVELRQRRPPWNHFPFPYQHFLALFCFTLLYKFSVFYEYLYFLYAFRSYWNWKVFQTLLA